MTEQALLAHHAYAAGVPLVACALYKKAAAGEVVLSVPAAGTACWWCAVGAGTPSDSYRPGRDYGLGGRLAGESALGPSIHLVAGVAASAALGLLAGPASPAGRHLKRLLSQRRTLGLIATTPAWDFFKTVFAGMDHQHAPQSVWVRVDPSADCPVCGTHPVPPLDTQAGSEIAHIIREHRQSIDQYDISRLLGIGELPMIPSPRPRSTRQALAGLQYALGTVAPPNPLVLCWRWRYELILGIGLPVALIVLGGIPVMLATLAALTVLAGAALLWAPARRHLIARAWCIITPHRVRVGCAQAWIHSRCGKIPIVLLTTRQPFGERVHLWCRAGTSAIDFTSARLLLMTACWARDIRVTGNERFRSS